VEQFRVKDRLAAIFATKTAVEWFHLLSGSDCCVTPIRSIAEIAAELPPFEGPPAPALGEHTQEILGALA
jgi:crotonobetainyl-CoA:carnitine CoA-transferase CaiB-like acyl-CoA transferase